MFTNMLASHHPHHPHRPPSPTTSMTTLSAPNYTSEQKYAPLHNAADAMRRMTSPYSSNLFSGLEDAIFARAEVLAAADYSGKNQFKPEPNSNYYPSTVTHYQQAAPVPPPVYSTMQPPPAFPHAPALTGSLESSDVIDQLGSARSSLPTYQPPIFNSSMVPPSDTHPHYITHPTPTYNPPNHFHPSSSAVHPPAPPASSASSSISSSNANSPTTSAPTTFPAQEYEADPRELEAFAEKKTEDLGSIAYLARWVTLTGAERRFKQRRIKLGVTQNDVGQALANLKLAGVGSLSQSTICRFESLTLSHNNMVALKPILIAWLDKAEEEHRRRMESAAMGDKKRKRTSIAAPEKRSLEAFFTLQPRPSSDKIAAIAKKLDLKKNVVRVWFCNQRQKQKRMKFSAFNADTIM